MKVRNYLCAKYYHEFLFIAHFDFHHLTEILACDPPSSPLNGYIIPYTSTVEGATVTYVFQMSNKIGHHSVCADVNFTAVCNNNGQWEPASGDVCFDSPGNGSMVISRYVVLVQK